MPADERYSVVDPKAIPTSPFYGCHNKPRPTEGQPVPSADGKGYPYRFTTDCRYDLAMSDSRCTGCIHAKPFKDWHQK